MQQGYDDVALDRGTDDGGEPVDEGTLLFRAQRDRIPDAQGQAVAVAQQKEQQVEHDEQADHKAERVLAKVDGLGDQKLSCLRQGRGYFCRDLAEVGHVKSFQQMVSPRGQGVEDPLKIPAKIQLS